MDDIRIVTIRHILLDGEKQRTEGQRQERQEEKRREDKRHGHTARNMTRGRSDDTQEDVGEKRRDNSFLPHYLMKHPIV